MTEEKKKKMDIHPKKKLKTVKTVKKRGRPKKEVKKIEEVEVKEIKKEIQKEEVQPSKEEIVKKDYIFAVGRRKEAVARVRYFRKKEGEKIIINGKKLNDYFPTNAFQQTVLAPLEIAGVKAGIFTVKVAGGGKRGQAESIRLGLARVIEKYDGELRKPLKQAGLLKRDARVKERKKYGLKRARRAPQWQKR